MEIIVKRDELLHDLVSAERITEKKTTIPILSHLRFTAVENGQFWITATDLDQSISIPCPAKVDKPGSCAIPASKLLDYVKLLREDQISIKLLENHWIQLRAGRSHSKLVGTAPTNFPKVPDFPKTATTRLPRTLLRTMISKTMFAISTEESRYTLNGALLVLKSRTV
jgi:DNA polymerase-3 subunit beta